MAAPSSPTLPSSFDPAIHLHSEGNSVSIPPPLSESHSSELEAFNLERLETIREKTKNGVVIQHRAWNLSEIFRSDEDIQPETPTKRRPLITSRNLDIGPSSDTIVPSSPPAKMPLISSPVQYPPSSPAPKKSDQKRKSEGPSSLTEPKRPRMIGGFLDDDDDDDDIHNLQDAQLPLRAPLGDSIGNSQLSNGSGAFNWDALNEYPSQNENLAVNAETDTPAAVTLSQTARLEPLGNSTILMKSCSGKVLNVKRRTIAPPVPYERLVADRSTTAPGRATRSYYGINIHQLMDEAAKEEEEDKIRRSREPVPEPIIHSREVKKKANPMWAEKYRAKKFTDLIGDDRTHRSVLRWLKGWDPIVFPGLAKSKKKTAGNDTEERIHKKILLLPGPPGLGKTTLAHVCAKQAGYEVLEINASDERSRDVVKGRIKDAVGTENVRGINVGTDEAAVRKAGKPICVIVDEVDGVTTGSGAGGGEGGFMKALIDLIMLDQRNSNKASNHAFARPRKSKGDKFRMLRPLILICNDAYHPSLRPLRTSSLAEVVQIRQPPLEKVIQRMKGVFEKEGIPCDLDGARRLCEASWGITSGRDNRNRAAGEGDIRSVLVAGEWVAHKFRSACLSRNTRLSKMWIEQHVLNDSLQGSSSRGLGRGGIRAIVDRVFIDGAGLPNTLSNSNTRQTTGPGQTTGAMGVAEHRRSKASNWLREMVDTSGEYDRCITDCFAKYPTQAFRDDTVLSKPNAAYEWLHFHDKISSKVFSNQEWELNPYLSQSVVAFHHLFASSNPQGWDADQNKNGDDEDEEEHPFSGPRADFAAYEAEKENRSILIGFQSSFSAHLTRLFNSPETVATDLIPNLTRMLSPDINPIVVGGSGQKGVASVRKESERSLVNSAVNVMSGIGVTFEKSRVEVESGTHGGWVYRMEPPLDTLTSFSKTRGSTTSSGGSSVPVRYAVRQVLDQEYRKEVIRRQSEAQKARYSGADSSIPGAPTQEAEVSAKADAVAKASIGKNVKRDFFGRVIKEDTSSKNSDSNVKKGPQKAERPKVWVKYHEGYSNAVRKPISMKNLLEGL